jgi:hypothetical protein
MRKSANQCKIVGCDQPKVAQGVLCWEHFVSNCYREIEKCAKQLESQNKLDESTCDSLNELAAQVVALSIRAENLTHLDRARLMDIILRSCEINQNAKDRSWRNAGV